MESSGNTNNIRHIQKVSQRYVALLNFLAFLVPAFALLFWVFFNQLPDWLLSGLPATPVQDLTLLQLLLGFAVSLLPVSVAVYGLVILKKLFSLYARAIIFSVENVFIFRRFAQVLFAWVVTTSLFTPLISLVVSYNNPVGQRTLVAELGLFDLFTVIIGGIFLVISWVMNEGHRMDDEQTHTI